MNQYRVEIMDEPNDHEIANERCEGFLLFNKIQKGDYVDTNAYVRNLDTFDIAVCLNGMPIMWRIVLKAMRIRITDGLRGLFGMKMRYRARKMEEKER